MPKQRLTGFVVTILVFVTAATSFSVAGLGGASSLEDNSGKGSDRQMIRVGEIESISDEVISAPELLSGRDSTRTIFYSGASYIKVHFRRFSLPPGSFVTVSTPSGDETYVYFGDPSTSEEPGSSDYTTDEEAGFWAMSVYGEEARVTVHVVDPDVPAMNRTKARRLGVVIDKYARGYPGAMDEGGITPQAVCGSDDRQNVICYQSSRPTEYGRSRAVARLLVNGTSLCTGWRVTSNNFMMTNWHCADTQSDISGTEAWFNFDTTTCTGSTTNTVTKVSGSTFFRTNQTLDYTLFSVNSFASISSFGFLELDPRAAIQGEEIYIPQHGGGQPKKLGIASDRNAGNLCRVDDPVANGNGTNTDLAYFCDTSGGSSGSPVIARSSNRVIAIHHLGSCGGGNLGARMELIFPEISGFLAAPITFETESLTVAARSSDTHRVALDSGYSGGQGIILEGNAVSDFVTYTVNVPEARTYDIRVRIKKLNNRGIWQFSSNGVNHGSPVDGFSSSAVFTEVDIGNVTFSSAGNKSFRFSITGKNASSSNFWIALDYIRLIPR